MAVEGRSQRDAISLALIWTKLSATNSLIKEDSSLVARDET